MSKIQIRHRWDNDNILYEGEHEDMREAVVAALKCSANLSSANLSSANLRSADLSFANLSSANLSSANLSSANLRSADLSSANLSSANLSSANLSFANLRSANLEGLVSGSNKYLRTVFTDIWPATYTAEVLQIGCQKHLIKDWWKFDDERIAAMDSEALEFWKVWKPILKKIIKAAPCDPTGYVETNQAAA